jgi:hypothetical protein
MPVKVRCPCGKLVLAREQLIGKRIKCPGCAKIIQVPSAEDKPVEPAAAAADAALAARPGSATKPVKPRAKLPQESPPAEPLLEDDLVDVEPAKTVSPRSRKSDAAEPAVPLRMDDVDDVEPAEASVRRARKAPIRQRTLWPWIVGGIGFLALIVVAVVFLIKGAQEEDTQLRYTFSDGNGYRSGRDRESVAKTLGMSQSQLQEWANDPAAADEKRLLGPPLQAGGAAATLFGQGFNETRWRSPSGKEMYTVRNQFLTLTSQNHDSALKIMTINGPEKVPTVEQVRAWAEDESAASEGRSAIMILAGHTESISRGILVRPPH